MVGEWRQLGEGLVVVEGPPVRDLGLPFTTRTTVVRLRDGSLLIESPVAVPYEVLARLTGLGPVRHLVANTPRHVWRLDSWHALFPAASLWSVRATPATLRHSRLPLDGTLSNRPVDAWAADLDQVAIHGSRFIEEVVFLHKPSLTLVVGDLIQAHELPPGRRLSSTVKKLSGIAGPTGGTSIDIKASLGNREALRGSVERLLGWDFDQVVLAHGPIVSDDAKAFVQRAFAWALP
jgi:hypothetical protein